MNPRDSEPRGLRALPSYEPDQVRLRGLFEAAISLARSVSEVGERLGGYAVDVPKHEFGTSIEPPRLSHWRIGRTPMPDWTGPALINVIDDLVHEHLLFRDKIAGMLSDLEVQKARELREAVQVIHATSRAEPTR